MNLPHNLLVIGFLFCLDSTATARVVVARTNYHGWPDAYTLDNGKAHVVVVPAIGRVMQFGFAGEEGVFWENRALDGKVVNADAGTWKSSEWVNLGGDKAWPSPEADWGKLTKRSDWRPPPAFDGLPSEAHAERDAIILTSPVDLYFGIRVQRRIRLHRSKPVMTITTTFERTGGEPAKIGVWTVTQLKEPVLIAAPYPKRSFFLGGYTLLGPSVPPSLVTNDNAVWLRRDPKRSFKIGIDGDDLLWIGAKHALLIHSPRVKGAEYPDQGSSTEIYTNPNPLEYIELEMLGPMHLMKAGDRIERSNIYTLLRRSNPTAEEEGKAILKQK